MADEVLLDINDNVMVITLNRPEARNAVNRAVADGVAAAVDELEARPDVSVGVLTGAGGTFCAGMDLKAFLTGDRAIVPGRGFCGLTQRPPAKPLIAAVEGWALAGGCEVALSADMVVAARDAKFGLTEVKRGLVAAAGGLLRLPKCLPYQVAMEVALTGEPLGAEDAHRHGLVNRLTDPGGALDEALRLARAVAVNAPLALLTTKRLVAGAVEWTDAEAYEEQLRATERIFESEDAREGARAFAERRPPVWRGA